MMSMSCKGPIVKQKVTKPARIDFRIVARAAPSWSNDLVGFPPTAGRLTPGRLPGVFFHVRFERVGFMKRDFSRRSDPTPGSEPSASMEALCELFSTLVLLLLLVPFVLGGRLRRW